jgi:mono/diheme cytochrome c family protein
MRLMPTWICLGLLVSAAAQANGSSEEPGRVLAQTYCSACHRVAAEQTPPPKVTVDAGSGSEEYETPSFRQVAARVCTQ